MQFDRAEFEGHSAGTCALCRTELAQSYYTLGGSSICLPCRERVIQPPPEGGLLRATRAIVAGVLAAVAGAALYLVAQYFVQEIELLMIASGLMVGAAVRWGAARQGGYAYQLLAIYLTYLSAGAALATDGLHRFGVFDGSLSRAAYHFVYMMNAFPAVSGVHNVVILGIAMVLAWKMNRSVHAFLAGPFPLTIRTTNG